MAVRGGGRLLLYLTFWNYFDREIACLSGNFEYLCLGLTMFNFYAHLKQIIFVKKL